MIGAGALRGRVLQVAVALGADVATAPASLDAAVGVLTGVIGAPSRQTSYLLLAVLVGEIPFPAEVEAFARDWELGGTPAAIATAIRRSRAAHRRHGPGRIRIESGVTIDVHDTAHTPGTTGIQRVVRSTLDRWLGEKNLGLVGWNDGFRAPRSLRASEAALVHAHAPRAARVEIVIPYNATWVLLEIATDQRRVDRIRTIALYSGSSTSAVGYDCIPMTSAETAGKGMPGSFARYLATLGQFDRVAAISGAALTEFSGFGRMLGGAGLPGPSAISIALPTSSDPGPADDALVRAAGVADEATLVLAVGSHEPRKNHLALLQAAELDWREGLEFTLVLAGGNSWARAGFDRVVAAARARGRSIITLSGASDATLWALYRRARFTIFPSLNEGFGLPVVESISAGTPVITSDFGSMRESAAGFGGLLVNPRSDHDIADAMRLLLTDDAELRSLAAQTARAPQRTWGEYAEELWAFCVPGSAARETK